MQALKSEKRDISKTSTSNETQVLPSKNVKVLSNKTNRDDSISSAILDMIFDKGKSMTKHQRYENKHRLRRLQEKRESYKKDPSKKN